MSPYPKSPCKGCIERHLACHDNCKQYIEWKADKKVIDDKIKQARERDRIMRDTAIKRTMKIKKMGGYK